MDQTKLEQGLEALGAVLADRGEELDLALVGGGALLILGLLQRPTQDLGVVARIESDRWSRARPFPPGLAQAVLDVANALDLPDDWLNPGSTDLLDLGLPVGFADRVEVRHYETLTIRLSSREDQIAFKLYAAVDQGPASKHFADLKVLSPTAPELLEAARWTRTQDPSDGFRSMLHQALETMGVDPLDV